MGEFNETVTTLLQAFSSGIEVIKRLRRRRKESREEVDASIKKEEQRLHRSLKRNRADVHQAYSHDRAKLGDRFEKGDCKFHPLTSAIDPGETVLIRKRNAAKAHSSLASILRRLHSGFINILDRFTNGESTRGDYQSLLLLSNESKIEAINTFGQLSSRLSRSQLTLQDGEARSRRDGVGKSPVTTKKHTSSSGNGKEAGYRAGRVKSKSAPDLSITKIHPSSASPQGWVKPKSRPNGSSLSSESDNSRPRQPKVKKPEEPRLRRKTHSTTKPTQLRVTHRRSPNKTHGRHHERASIISFSSDSTKLGEVPERHFSRPVDFVGGLHHTAFPLNSFREPEKQRRSRFIRLFSRGD